jgi:fatty acid desaturase
MTQITEQAPYDQERRDLARKRVESIRGFYVHLMIYLTVNGGLLLLDAILGDGWWFYWIAVPWGIGLAANAVAVFSDRLFGPEWEARQVDKILTRQRARRP